MSPPWFLFSAVRHHLSLLFALRLRRSRTTDLHPALSQLDRRQYVGSHTLSCFIYLYIYFSWWVVFFFSPTLTNSSFFLKSSNNLRLSAWSTNWSVVRPEKGGERQRETKEAERWNCKGRAKQNLRDFWSIHPLRSDWVWTYVSDLPPPTPKEHNRTK